MVQYENSAIVGGTIKYHNIPPLPRIPEKKDKKAQLSTSRSSSLLALNAVDIASCFCLLFDDGR